MRWLDRITFEICAWWTSVRLHRANPKLRELEHKIAAARKAHKPRRHLLKALKAEKVKMMQEGV